MMSRSERRIHNNRVRRSRERRKNLILSLLTICLVTVLSFTANVFLSSAHAKNKDVEFKYYKSILVQSGDTLWSIAADASRLRHETEDTDILPDDTEKYVEEIMRMNGLNDDRITAGKYLVIPYYSHEFAG